MADRWKRLAPISGVLFVGLMVATLAITGNSPDGKAGGAKVIAYYAAHHGRTNLSVLFLGYAAVFAVVYFVSVAHFLRARGAEMMATLTVAGGVVMATSLAMAAGAAAALSDGNGHLTAASAQAVNLVTTDIWFVGLFAGIAVATLAMAISMLRTHALPKALGIVTLVVGIVAASGIGTWFAFLASGPLTIVIALYVYQRLGQPQSITLPGVPNQPVAADTTETTTSKATTS
jgi:hypothetical protein